MLAVLCRGRIVVILAKLFCRCIKIFCYVLNLCGVILISKAINFFYEEVYDLSIPFKTTYYRDFWIQELANHILHIQYIHTYYVIACLFHFHRCIHDTRNS